MLNPARMLITPFHNIINDGMVSETELTWFRKDSETSIPTSTIQRREIANQSAKYGVSNLRMIANDTRKY